MPTPRDSRIAAVYDNRIYVVGGQTITAISNSVSRAIEIYDPARNSWHAADNMPLARHGIGAAALMSPAATSRRHSAAASR